ncbi:hypothetical protein RMCBS344292_07969 [Rhizopus microsporus]|nr:hypothetical protein RMCBS344292_07969 [Rhizopus microsporus]
MVFLPESSDFMSSSQDQMLKLAAPLDSHAFLNNIRRAAKEHNIWVSVGVHESSSEPKKVNNIHVIVNDKGDIVSIYRKTHMYSSDMNDGPTVDESKSTTPGDEITPPVDTPLGKMGSQICYDLRYPEISIKLRNKGAEILTFPSAFTPKTGAHWEILLRARAVENQAFVIASGQIGQHNEKRESFGHAMIVDPWGTVLAECADNAEIPGMAIAPIDIGYLKQIRKEQPVFENRRYDLYPKIE